MNDAIDEAVTFEMQRDVGLDDIVGLERRNGQVSAELHCVYKRECDFEAKWFRYGFTPFEFPHFIAVACYFDEIPERTIVVHGGTQSQLWFTMDVLTSRKAPDKS